MSIDESSLLKPFPYLGGYNAAELWWTVGLCLPTWFLLVVAPRWKHTPALTLVTPIFHATIYTLGAITALLVTTDDNDNDNDNDHNRPAPDMATFQGVLALLRDPNVAFLGWIHYVAYDPLVARWIVLDSIERGCCVRRHVLLIVPTLYFCLTLGPMGFLIYVAFIRTFLLPVGSEAKID
eukprot:jgi/Psemu1/249880/estExt_Genewise1Plus.C_90061